VAATFITAGSGSRLAEGIALPFHSGLRGVRVVGVVRRSGDLRGRSPVRDGVRRRGEPAGAAARPVSRGPPAST